MIINRKPTFAELCDTAILTQADIVRGSGLSIPTVQRIMRGESVREISLRQALNVINEKLNRNYEPRDIEALYT